MPIICIGPVCIPITAILPVLLFIFKPIYDRLPLEYQKKIDYGIRQCQLCMNRCWKRVWPSKSKENKTDAIGNKSSSGLIKKIENEDEWDALIEQSKNDNLIFIAYFTSQLTAIISFRYIDANLYKYVDGVSHAKKFTHSLRNYAENQQQK